MTGLILSFLFILNVLSHSAVAESPVSSDFIKLPTVFSSKNISYHIRKHPVELPENYIFPNQVAELSDDLNYITNAFKQKFLIDIQVEVSLVRVENGGDHDPIGEYSFHKIVFGKLSKAQFDQLDTYYQFPFGVAPNKRIFEASKIYSLQDFLLPKMQPLLGKTFFGFFKKSTIQPDDTTGEMITYIPNCWTTVHDMLTSDQDPFSLNGLIYGFGDGGKYFIDLYRNSDFFDPLKADIFGFRAYDVLAHILEDVEIGHTAVVIGPGIVFEKQAPGNEGYAVRPFRTKEFYEFYRMKKPLTLPKDLPSLDINEQFLVSNPAQVVFDNSSNEYVLDSNGAHHLAIKSAKLITCDAESMDKGLCDNMGIETAPVYSEAEE